MLNRFILVTLIVLAAARASLAQNHLTIFIWSDYLAPEIAKDFANKFACNINVIPYDDAESMLAAINRGEASQCDLVLPPDYLVPTLVKSNALAPLRHENIPNLKNLDQKFAGPPFDAGNRYTVAYQWGTVGVYVRKPKGGKLEETWGAIFDSKKQLGPFVLLDSPRDVIGAALKYKGQSLNSTNPKYLGEAKELLFKSRKRGLGFAAGPIGRNRVLAKTASAAMVYSADGLRGMQIDPETLYFIPQEGAQIWVDNLAILAKAPNRDMAEKFINHVLDAKIGAQLSDFTRYATPNKAARQFIRPEDSNNAALYPRPELMSKLEFRLDTETNSAFYRDLWSRIKAK
jgi:spermidine/putrescine transport system substrate-binding protein